MDAAVVGVGWTASNCSNITFASRPMVDCCDDGNDSNDIDGNAFKSYSSSPSISIVTPAI